MSDFVCTICEKTIKGEWGNNPRPVKQDGKCCDECNMNIVVPERIKEVNKQK